MLMLRHLVHGAVLNLEPRLAVGGAWFVNDHGEA